MKVIGITGGVGAGKSQILSYISEAYRDKARILIADKIAHELQSPGQEGYLQIVKHFGKGILKEDQTIDRKKLGELVFSDSEELKILNSIVHPLVKRYIVNEIEKEKINGKLSFIIIEAALLIEDKYDTICDELWYLYTKEEIRSKRLKESRQYSDEKINSIFQNQLSEEEFRKNCAVVIDNNTSLEATYRQIDKWLEGR